MLSITPFSDVPQPQRAQLRASMVELLAKTIGASRGLVKEDTPLAHLATADQHTLRQYARFAMNPDNLAEAVQVQLRRVLCRTIHDKNFDQLTIEEREEIAAEALTAWHAVLDVLNGAAAELPAWEYRCLTFSGEYDPALLRPQAS
jgi:hypothetical protein